jgi:hypothetical protein
MCSLIYLEHVPPSTHRVVGGHVDNLGAVIECAGPAADEPYASLHQDPFILEPARHSLWVCGKPCGNQLCPSHAARVLRALCARLPQSGGGADGSTMTRSTGRAGMHCGALTVLVRLFLIQPDPAEALSAEVQDWNQTDQWDSVP